MRLLGDGCGCQENYFIEAGSKRDQVKMTVIYRI